MRKVSIIFIILGVFFIGSCTNASSDVQKEGKQSSYNVIIQESQNGKISVSKATCIKAGEEVILSVEADSGYFLKQLTAVNAKNKDLAVAAIETDVSYKFTMSDSDVTVSALFAKKEPIDITNPEDLNSANGNTMYRIEHYQQDLDDTSSYTLYAIQKKKGNAGADTTADAKDYTGFTSLTFSQKKIATDGSTVVEIYYNRKTITYTFELHGGNWEGSEGTVVVSGLYGAVVDKPCRPGYTLNWSRQEPKTFGPENQTFLANWIANTSTMYFVKIYYQNIEGGNNYTLYSDCWYTGTTDTRTNYIASSKTGFIVKPYEQINIDGDETSVLNIYYDRERYSISFELNGGSGDQSLEVLYGSKIHFNNTPAKEGHSIWCWYTDSEYTQTFDINDKISSSMTLYADWVNDKITYRMHDKPELLPNRTNGTAGEGARYVLFGDYPQSLKEDDVGIYDNITVTMGDMTAYCGYDGNLYICEDSKYYKVEPIKWRIITEGNYTREQGDSVLESYGIYGLLSEAILTCMNWRDGYLYLRNTFINDAFIGKKYIKSIPLSDKDQIYYVDAVYLSKKDLENQEETFSNRVVYSESGEEIESYYYYNNPTYEVFDCNSRCKTGTDYAKKYQIWWTNTQGYNGNNVCYTAVNYDGCFDEGNSKNIKLGVVPAILIRMPEEVYDPLD